eukprot:scaffold123204_cov33-Tisochrysis_lutea.AAC.5
MQVDADLRNYGDGQTQFSQRRTRIGRRATCSGLTATELRNRLPGGRLFRSNELHIQAHQSNASDAADKFVGGGHGATVRILLRGRCMLGLLTGGGRVCRRGRLVMIQPRT